MIRTDAEFLILILLLHFGQCINSFFLYRSENSGKDVKVEEGDDDDGRMDFSCFQFLEKLYFTTFSGNCLIFFSKISYKLTFQF